MSDWDEKQVDAWHRLHERVTNLLARHGKEYSNGGGDYLVVDDNYGWRRIIISFQNLKMFNPEIVNSLRGLLSELPEWEIVAAVDVPDKKKVWPIMGLTIRKHEVIDGLQRQYFPVEFQNLNYEDSRPGTGYE